MDRLPGREDDADRLERGTHRIERPDTERAARPALSGIYGIVDLGLTPDPLPLVRDMLGAGIRVVQYRAKSGVDRGRLAAVHRVVRAHGGVLIVNDDFEAALDADGWHAGQEDLAGRPVADLRGRLGSRLFGVSCGTPDEARIAETSGADYVGCGPFATTGTKADAGAAIGAAGIRAVANATSLPVVAIGGIDAANLAAVVASGASMAAVISAIARAQEPERAARELVERWSALAR